MYEVVQLFNSIDIPLPSVITTGGFLLSVLKGLEMENELLEKLNIIERNTLLAAKNMLTFDDVSLLTGLSKGTLYKLTSSHKIPYYKPNGKLVYFKRSEIEEWQAQNRVESVDEAMSAAQKHIVDKAMRGGAR